jgi:hypothetical protein
VGINLPPVAAETTTPMLVSFDASASYDPEGGDVNFFWTFDDGAQTSTEVAPTTTT